MNGIVVYSNGCRLDFSWNQLGPSLAHRGTSASLFSTLYQTILLQTDGNAEIDLLWTSILGSSNARSGAVLLSF